MARRSCDCWNSCRSATEASARDVFTLCGDIQYKPSEEHPELKGAPINSQILLLLECLGPLCSELIQSRGALLRPQHDVYFCAYDSYASGIIAPSLTPPSTTALIINRYCQSLQYNKPRGESPSSANRQTPKDPIPINQPVVIACTQNTVMAEIGAPYWL